MGIARDHQQKRDASWLRRGGGNCSEGFMGLQRLPKALEQAEGGNGRFAPFVRRDDSWGRTGAQPASRVSVLQRLLVYCSAIPLIRLLVSCCVFVSFFLLVKARLLSQAQVQRVAQLLSKLVLRVNGVRLHIQRTAGSGEEKEVPKRAPVVVANHVSWIDILLLTAVFGSGFIAKSSLQQVPLVASVTRALGCGFVDRSAKGAGTADDIRVEVQKRSGSNPLLIFPEGTTTNGKYLLRFKRGAFLAGTTVQPVVIQYHKAKNAFSPAWETCRIGWHLFGVLANGRVDATVRLLPEYEPKNEEKAQPEQFANSVRLTMAQAFSPPVILSDSSFEDKREYHRQLLQAGLA